MSVAAALIGGLPAFAGTRLPVEDLPVDDLPGHVERARFATPLAQLAFQRNKYLIYYNIIKV